MKINELRIGNYVKGTHEVEIDRGNGIIEDVETDVFLRVRGIDQDAQLVDGSCVFSLEEIQTDYQIEKFAHIEPIPLTEQWLIDFGFKKHKLLGSYFNGQFRFHTQKPHSAKDFGFFSEIYFCERQVLSIGGVRNVHQLQNLYFALVGEELTLKKNH